MTLTSIDIIEVGETLWPFTYYIIIDNKKRKKILFSSLTSEMFTKMNSNNAGDSIDKVKSQFEIHENKE